MAEKDINEWMSFFAKGAEEFATFLELPVLDYSIESIKQIEEMCIIVLNEKPKSFLSKLTRSSAYKKDLTNTSLLFGGYIGEVMIRNYGGNWSGEKTSQNGEGIILNINDTKIFPVEKVYRKLNNQDIDNLYQYYQLSTAGLPKIVDRQS
jgi:hypothetical protein